MKEVIKILEKHVADRGIDRHRGLEILCDFLLDLYDARHYLTPDGWHRNVYTKSVEEPHLFRIGMIWMQRVAEAMERGEWLDFFGGLYEEMYQTRGKASVLGQFFTPEHLCDLLTKCAASGDERCINDPACGSERTLLAHFARSGFSPSGYYIGEDIDTISVKMCALNMMAHGMRGRVVRHDTLKSPLYFDYGFELNEIRYPMPTIYYSVRRIQHSKEEQ